MLADVASGALLLNDAGSVAAAALAAGPGQASADSALQPLAGLLARRARI